MSQNPRKTLIAIHSTIGQLVEQLDEMLGELLSGDEEVIEGGEGLKGKDTDEALSGIKLYKGETLLELTERWKLLQNKLYNEEKDTFDLSRVPDVHDVSDNTIICYFMDYFRYLAHRGDLVLAACCRM